MVKRPEIEALLLQGKSPKEVAATLGKSVTYVRQVRLQIRGALALGPKAGAKKLKAARAEKPKLGEAPYESEKKEHNESYYKSQHQELSKRYSRALKDASVTDRLVESILDILPRSYEVNPAMILRPPDNKETSPQSAVLLLSDTHVGKEVCAAQTMGMGNYNLQVFLDRLQHLEDSTVSIAHDHTVASVDELVVLLMGDILDGSLTHSNEVGQVTTMFNQFYVAGHAIAQMLRNLAHVFPKVRVHTVVGNHGRFPHQKKTPTMNRYSNLDMFAYAMIQALLRDIPNIEMELNQQPFQIVEVKNSIIHEAHGDHLRGGDKAMGIPAHSIGRQLSNISQLRGKHHERLPNFYCFGHFHRDIALPHVNGKVFVNGAFPGIDNYSLAENMASTDPTQLLFMIHPKYGLGAQYAIGLHHADPGSHRYTIPEALLQ